MLRGDLVNARRKFLKAYEREPGNPTIANNLQLLNRAPGSFSGSCAINLMALSASLSHVVLVITAAVLFYVALTDFNDSNPQRVYLGPCRTVHRPRAFVRSLGERTLEPAFAALMFCTMLCSMGRS